MWSGDGRPDDDAESPRSASPSAGVDAAGGEGSSSASVSGSSSSGAVQPPAELSTGRWPLPGLRPASVTNVMQISGGGGDAAGGGGGFFSTMQRSVQLGGQSALLLRLLLSNLAGAAAGDWAGMQVFRSHSCGCTGPLSLVTDGLLSG